MSGVRGVLSSCVIDTYLPVPDLPTEWEVPASAEWTAALAALTTMDALDSIYIEAESTGLRGTAESTPGVADEAPVGAVPNWLAPTTFAIAANGQRPVYFEDVDGLPALVFDGNIDISGNDRLALAEAFSRPQGAFSMVVRMSSDASRGTVDQTALQIAPLRVIARKTDASPTPAIRVGSSTYLDYDGGTLFEIWGLLEGEWSAGTARIRRNGEEWQSFDISSSGLMTNTIGQIARSTYEAANGAPFAGALHRLLLMSKIPSSAQWETFRALMLAGTGISDATPEEPTVPEGEVIPPALSVGYAANTADLANLLAGAPAGRHIVLTTAGPYTWPSTISASGTAENPIVVYSQLLLQPAVNGAVAVDGSNIYAVGLSLRDTVTMNGSNIRFVRWIGRDRTSDGEYFIDNGQDNVIGYFSVANLSTSDSAIVDARPRNGSRRLRVHHGDMNNWRRLPIKLGNQASESYINTGYLVDHCVFDGENTVPADSTAAFHSIEMKCSGCTIKDNYLKRCTSSKGSITIRHGTNNLVRDNRWDAGFGGQSHHKDNSWYNNKFSGKLRAAYGNVDGNDNPIVLGGSQYPNSINMMISYHRGNIAVGEGFGDYVYPATNTRILDQVSGTVTYVSGRHTGTTTTGTNPFPAPAAEPPVITDGEVGPNAVGGGYALPVAVAEWFAKPFSKDSAYHRRVGSGLVVADDSYAVEDEWKAMRDAWLAVVPSNNGQTSGGTIGAINQGAPFGTAAIYGTAADPLRTIRFRNCTDTGAGIGVWQPGGSSTQRRIPTTNGINTTPANQCYENTAWIVNEDSFEALELFQANNRGGGDYTGSIGRLLDIRGLGHPSELEERVGVSASGCSVRMGLLDTDALMALQPIQHALKLAVYSGYTGEAYALLGRKIQWPAGNADSFAGNPSFNTGPFRYGTLMVIPAAVDLGSFGITTPQGLLIAQCLQDYGGYIMDDANGIVVRASYSATATITAAIVADYRKCLRQLRPAVGSVTNATASIAADGGYNQTGSIGTPNGGDTAGGGTPRAVNSALDA